LVICERQGKAHSGVHHSFTILHQAFRKKMITVLIVDNHNLVRKVLQRWPRAFSIFMRNKTKRPGCFMRQFCTLKDVADTYQLSLEKLVDEIKNLSE